MSTAEDLAAVRTAIVLCNNNYELKKEILCAPGSEYDRNKNNHKSMDPDAGRQKVWKQTLERTTRTILEKLGLGRVLLEKVTSLVISIALRMLTWAKHHEAILGISHQFIIKFLNSSFFTSRGIIDDKKAAEELMKNCSLSLKQKYVLACHYCFTDHIHDLFRQMSQEERLNTFHATFCPAMVRFWSVYLAGEIDKYLEGQTVDQYRLESAIESRCLAAVQYCLEETSLSRKEDAVRDTALETIRKTGDMYRDSCLFIDSFGVKIYATSRDSLTDIFTFLFAKMNEEQKIELLKEDIEESDINHGYSGSRVLKIFLDWPYQNNFMKTAALTWDFLPEKVYAKLLLSICQKINPGFKDRNNGEEKSYDYHKLLKEFWTQSPDHYKRYVFHDEQTSYRVYDDILQHINQGFRLLIVKLFTLKSYAYKDRKVVELILESATDEEKESIISSKRGKHICFDLMLGEKWETLDIFLSKCISSKVEEVEFKRRIIFTEEVRIICAHFIKYKWEAAEFFLKWSSLSKEEIIRFKKEICSDHGKNVCWYLYLHKGGEVADRCCEWFFSSEEEIRKFKRELIFSVGVEKCTDFLIEGEVEVFEKFIKWSHLSQEGITEFKKHLQYEKGNFICEKLISGGKRYKIYDDDHICMFDHTVRFQGGQWEQVEKFLTWCFSSEEEIRRFKRDRLLKISGAEIHFQLIESNQWGEAETFFAWLELSPEEVRELKKETLFNHEKANNMFQVLTFRRTPYVEFLGGRSIQEILELLLRWYLTDKETVLRFRDHFKRKYKNMEICAEGWVAVREFESAIEQHLCDLDENQRPTKRNSELTKHICNVKRKKVDM